MASRRLAFSLKQAARSRAALRAINPVKRGFATPVNYGATTESTTLSNGLTVGQSLQMTAAVQANVGGPTDRNGALAMGADFHGGRMDRCRKPGRDRQDERDGTLS
jgi:hypothetical protein